MDVSVQHDPDVLRPVEREDGDVAVTFDAEVAHSGETVPPRPEPVRSS